MNLAGSAHQFLGDILPSDFRAEIFSLVELAWSRMPDLRKVRLEPRITGLLQKAMITEQESRYQADPPFFISEDVKKRNPKTGKEKERSDVEIHLRSHHIKGQKPYFVFESKRLNVSYGSTVTSNAHEYVGEGGMGCLLDGGYETVPDYSGMLAYVMDGNIASAKKAVEAQMAKKSDELSLQGEAKIKISKLMPKDSEHGETYHMIGTRKSTMFHMLLPVISSNS
jgi:hypothetical protein